MQPPSESPQLRRYHSTGLLFPCISEESNIDDWPERLATNEQILREDMAFHTDDGSVDGTVSSVGESTWDMIDEGSVASEDLSYIPPRTPASVSDGLESVHVPQPSPPRPSDVKSASDEDSDQEDLVSDMVMSEPPHSPQATPVALYAQETDTPVYGGESSYTQELMGTIHLQDVSALDSRLGIRIVSAQARTFYQDEPREALKSTKGVEDIVPLSGKIQMGLKDGGLEVRDTFKLLYHGPKEMKSAITQKIGSALAANPRRPLLHDGPASSRVTVVPISSFMDESSPEVVMIESGGFDMIIEECIGARRNESGGVTLDIESGNTIEYRTTHNSEGGELEILAPTGVPDLGIIYFPEKTVPSKRLSEQLTSQSCLSTQHFLLDCGIPYYVISDTDWLDDLRMPVIGSYRLVPHRSMDVLIDAKPGTRTLPIDLTSFLALDASQLHQNLVALKTSAAEPNPRFMNESVPYAKELRRGFQWISQQTDDFITAMKHIGLKTWITVAVIFFTMCSVPLLGGLYADRRPLGSTGETNLIETMPINEAAFSKLGMTKSQFDIQMKSSPPSLARLLAAETQHIPARAQAARKRDGGMNRKSDTQSRSRDLLVRVIGNSNILIRSFKPSSGAKNLKFETTRNGKVLPHQLQKIDEEYLVLEIPSADAYGQIEIRIWTTVKPKYNQTFEIDLGIPWFKVKGWKEIVKSTAEDGLKETRALQQSLLNTLKRGGFAIDDLRRSEAVVTALRKLSQLSTSVERAVHSGSGTVLRRSVRRAARARRQLFRLARKVQRATLSQSDLVLEKQARLNAELKEIIHLMSARLSEQQVRLEKALWTLQNSTKSRRLPQTYKKQLRKAQKKLLHTWWKLRGNPI